MNREFLLSITALLFVFLAACGQSTEVYELKEDDMTSKITVKHKNNEITEQITEETMTYEALGVGSKEEAKMIFAFMEMGLASVPGVDLDVKYKKNEITHTVKIDYKKADFGELFGMGSLFTDVDFGDMTDLKEVEEMLIAQGYTKK